ncbi:DUF4291 domain-containing protein [Terrimonas sp. NA20]|uniref:DUF4291 domain-containing protein n=1 Tax=Terrimonas ginsenosidimutans TaxID=2908004 RepID=A0ABS9KTW2_9BACT|nr:DUF4291 domain-containing protein [Terrimonas ginsenosidimutans]MCG2615766.1 DUF4291 domain-containing protein [Terrimonas ginsenosidimutans]
MRNIEIGNYETINSSLPRSGQQIVAQHTENDIIVYQAYNPSIADYAVKEQRLGGNAFSYNRMSWIKPNFLWMMYRCGWAAKENQERVLAIRIRKKSFLEILENAAISSFRTGHHESFDAWKNELADKEVRLQWDPDHDPFGNKLTRRAIQLGLKGTSLKNFGQRDILQIDDITPFVEEQRQFLKKEQLHQLRIPVETVWNIGHPLIERKVGIINENSNAL